MTNAFISDGGERKRVCRPGWSCLLTGGRHFSVGPLHGTVALFLTNKKSKTNIKHNVAIRQSNKYTSVGQLARPSQAASHSHRAILGRKLEWTQTVNGCHAVEWWGYNWNLIIMRQSGTSEGKGRHGLSTLKGYWVAFTFWLDRMKLRNWGALRYDALFTLTTGSLCTINWIIGLLKMCVQCELIDVPRIFVTDMGWEAHQFYQHALQNREILRRARSKLRHSNRINFFVN